MATSEKIDWCIGNFKGGDFRFVPENLIIVDSVAGKEGDKIQIKNPKMLFMGNKIILDPKILEKTTINATIVKHQRGEKIIVYKCRRRKNSRRKSGHRQEQTVIKIDSINY